MSKTILTISTALFIAITTSAVSKDGVANPVVSARMDAMDIIGQNMKIIGEMAQGRVTFDTATAQAAIDAIATQAGDIPALYKADETDPKSKSNPTIWANWDDFTKKSAALQTVAEGADTSSAAGLGQAMSGLGGSCQACHMSYRIK